MAAAVASSASVASPEAANGTTVNFLKLRGQRDNRRGKFGPEKLRLKERQEGVMEEESLDLAHRCTGLKPRAAARTENAIATVERRGEER